MNTEWIKVNENQGEKHSAIILKDANDWMQEAASLPPFKRLVGDLWIDGEISILFASSGVGKTIFAVQIADNLTRGESTQGLVNDYKEPLRVALLDFELSSRQFYHRYCSDEHGSYKFNTGYFFRAELNPEADLDKDFNTMVLDEIEKLASIHGLRYFIIDNITWLRNRTEDAKDAAPLMRQLNVLKKKYGLSMLILAHTPKRDASKPITANDLQGSSALMHFTDAAFAIGFSTQGSDIRYLKQIKVRSVEKVYDEDNVLTFQIVKPENFSRFRLITDVHERSQSFMSPEREHLIKKDEEYWSEINEQVRKYHKDGLTQRAIADKLSISPGKVNSVLKNVI
jgi:hypothetical protein